MIDDKVKLVPDRPVLDQIMEFHKLSYMELAKKLNITDGALRKLRSGNRGLRLSMEQIKTISYLLKPFDTRIDELPNDWILEKKERSTKGKIENIA
jgi:transcriptional regulator with XRE-family HTH domain